MDHLRRIQRSYRYNHPGTFAYKFMLVVLVVGWVALVLAPSWWFARADLASLQWRATLRVVCATASTLLVVAAVVGDFRGRRPFNGRVLLPAASFLVLLSLLLPTLI